jgi:medium-chain acyl-[acyl-carrier-protein] hydrolase
VNADKGTHREELAVKSYDLDHTGRASILAICGWLQEAAGIHAKALGVGPKDLFAKGLAWALHKMRIEIEERPPHGERVIIETWPSDLERLVAHRDFLVHAGDGRLLAKATSVWVLFNLETRRAGRGVDELGVGVTERPRATRIQTRKPRTIDRVDLERHFRVRRSDLDVNGHANHSVYLDWVTESVPREMWTTHRLAAIEIAFRDEGVYGDEITIASQALEPHLRYRHRIARARDGVELARAETSWISGAEPLLVPSLGGPPALP